MSNPRKFSEKIALHNQKQAEETAAFEQIMREVSGATRAPVTINHHQASYQNQHLYINPSFGAYRGGSLPNVNQIGNNTIDLQNALDNLESMKQGHDCLTERIQRDNARHMTPRSRAPNCERRRDVLPYDVTSYLSPPPDTSWRRTNSDSALHQSASTPLENSPLGSINNLHLSSPCANSPVNHHRCSGSANHLDNSLLSDKNYLDNKHGLQSPSSPHRPKSCEVPGINIYPSQEESTSPGSTTPHIPISSSTGSLPDLTNLHFPPPLATPLDSEDQVSYSSNNALSENQTIINPALIANNGLENHQYGTLQNGVHQLPQHPQDALHSSSLKNNGSRLSNIMIQNPKLSSQLTSSSTVKMPNKKGIFNNPMIVIEQYSQPHESLSQYGMYREDLMSSISGTQAISGSYRVRSSSPGGNSTCSAPTSPVSPSSSPGLESYNNYNKNSPQNCNYFVQQQQTNALQHQFENFNMLQDSVQSPSSVNNGIFGGVNDNSISDQEHVANLSDNSMYYASSQQQQTSSHNSLLPHPPPYSSSNTVMNRLNQPDIQAPSTLPEIILTAPGVEDAMLRQDFVKDLGNAMASLSGSFDSELFVGADEALRAGLDPIDLDGLQMLTDSDIPIDPAAEETFRNERL